MNKIIKCHVLPWIMNQIKYFSFIGQKLMKNNSSEENWKVNLQTAFKSCCDCQLEIKLCWAKQFSRRVWDDSKDYYRRGNARQSVSTSSGDKRGNLFFVPGQFILPRPESIVVGPILSCIITTEVPTSLEQSLVSSDWNQMVVSLSPSQHIHTSPVISWKLVQWFGFRNNFVQNKTSNTNM